jgi:hypothetical protein
MRLSLGFILFLALAVLMLVNAIRAFRSAAGSTADKRAIGPAPLLTGVVSLIVAVALIAGAFYMFLF